MQELVEPSSAPNPGKRSPNREARTVPTCAAPRYADPTREIQGIGAGARALRRAAVSASLALFAVGCSRTGLDAMDAEPATATPIDGALDAPPEPQPEAGPDAAPGAGGDAGSRCVPRPEQCNGKDDDCNGLVDDGIAPIPCAGGGERYCIAGRMSACPQPCELCVPGSERVCFLSYCQYWAVQTCSSDGRSFGICREHVVPPECSAYATPDGTARLEQCCIDHGYCCLDESDLDHDGNRTEMLGSCSSVSCTGGAP